MHNPEESAIGRHPSIQKYGGREGRSAPLVRRKILVGFQPVIPRSGFYQNGNAVGKGKGADHGFLNLWNGLRLVLVEVHQQLVVNLQDKAGPGAFQ